MPRTAGLPEDLTPGEIREHAERKRKEPDIRCIGIALTKPTNGAGSDASVPRIDPKRNARDPEDSVRRPGDDLVLRAHDPVRDASAARAAATVLRVHSSPARFERVLGGQDPDAAGRALVPRVAAAQRPRLLPRRPAASSSDRCAVTAERLDDLASASADGRARRRPPTQVGPGSGRTSDRGAHAEPRDPGLRWLGRDDEQSPD